MHIDHFPTNVCANNDTSDLLKYFNEFHLDVLTTKQNIRECSIEIFVEQLFTAFIDRYETK